MAERNSSSYNNKRSKSSIPKPGRNSVAKSTRGYSNSNSSSSQKRADKMSGIPRKRGTFPDGLSNKSQFPADRKTNRNSKTVSTNKTVGGDILGDKTSKKVTYSSARKNNFSNSNQRNPNLKSRSNFSTGTYKNRNNFRSKNSPINALRKDDGAIGGDMVVGKRAVAELLNAKHRAVYEIFVTDSNRDPSVREITKLAESLNIRWHLVSQFYLDEICEMTSHQSIAARCQSLKVYELSELVEIADKKVTGTNSVPLLVAVDEVVDVQNLGAILRNASCFGATGVILPVHRSAKITPSVTKIAAGAIEYLRFALVGGIPNALLALRNLDVLTVGLEGSAKVSVSELKVENSTTCLVVGSEQNGISLLAKKRCEQLVRIPQLNNPGSLNAASASAIGLYEISKKLLEYNIKKTV
jgi:23S rRNA (guanosine2251-2'-O)-methyltransferase